MEHQMHPTNQSGVHLELCVRSLTGSADTCRLDVLIDEAESLIAKDRIDTFDTTVWGDELPLDRPPRTGTGRALYDLLGQFELWADQGQRKIRPFFQSRTVTDELTSSGEEREVMNLPDVAIAEFRDGVLEWVSPHQEANCVHSVQDHLSAIATDEGARSTAGGNNIDADERPSAGWTLSKNIEAE